MERKKVGGGPVKLEVGMESVIGNSLGTNGTLSSGVSLLRWVMERG